MRGCLSSPPLCAGSPGAGMRAPGGGFPRRLWPLTRRLTPFAVLICVGSSTSIRDVPSLGANARTRAGSGLTSPIRRRERPMDRCSAARAIRASPLPHPEGPALAARRRSGYTGRMTTAANLDRGRRRRAAAARWSSNSPSIRSSRSSTVASAGGAIGRVGACRTS